MKARVLYLNDTHNVPGGAEYQVTQLVKAVQGAGGEALVACIPGSRTEADFQAAGVATVPLASLRSNPLAAVRKIKRICRERSIDIIHTASFLTNYAGRRAAKALGLPAVTTVHCEPDSILLAKPGLLVHAELLARSSIDITKHTAMFIAVSNAVAAKLIARGVPERKVTVISNGIDGDRVRRAAVEGETIDAQRGPGELLIGAMARLDAVKALDVLVKAVALLVQRGFNAKAVIIGEGDERPALDKLVAELGVADRVIFTGYLENPYPQLAAVDIYVVSSHSEGQNLTVLVAMALALPVVATAVGGIVDMVADERSGLLVPPRDPQALAVAIERLAGDEGLRRRLVEGGGEVLTGFTTAEMCRRTLDVYERLLSLSPDVNRQE